MLLRSEEASLSIIQSLMGGGEEDGEAGWGEKNLAELAVKHNAQGSI